MDGLENEISQFRGSEPERAASQLPVGQTLNQRVSGVGRCVDESNLQIADVQKCTRKKQGRFLLLLILLHLYIDMIVSIIMLRKRQGKNRDDLSLRKVIKNNDSFKNQRVRVSSNGQKKH